MPEEQQVDYKAELKTILGNFDQAAEKGGEAVAALRDGITRLARLTQSALRGTQFEKQADLLAVELARAGVTVETLHNAPLKVTRTGGADVYKVMDKLQKAAAEEETETKAESPAQAPQASVKTESGRK